MDDLSTTESGILDASDGDSEDFDSLFFNIVIIILVTMGIPFISGLSASLALWYKIRYFKQLSPNLLEV